jgi:hypothetical protein
MAQLGMGAQPPKRPWYLVVALSLALALGMTGACNGSALVQRYHAPVDTLAAIPAIRDIAADDDRAAVQARFDAYISTLDGARQRGWPLAVALLLLGSATVFFSMRVIGGSGGGRSALLQLIVVQAALAPVAQWLMRDVDEAETRVEEAMLSARARAGNIPAMQIDAGTMALRARGPVGLALHTLGCAFVLVGLTRRGSRAYFEGTAEAVEEQ